MSSPKVSVQQRFGEHLRAVRVGAGLTQEGLAQAMADRGFKWLQTTVTKTEASTRPLLLEEFVGLCDALKLDAGMTLTIAQGPAIKRHIRLDALRAQVAAAEREAASVQESARAREAELEALRVKLRRLEADE